MVIMSKEAVLQVKAAEDEAKKIILDAENRASLMIEEARKSAENDYFENRQSLEAEYKRRVDQVVDDAEFLISERLREAERDAEVLCAEATPNIPPVVREIVRRIMNECQ